MSEQPQDTRAFKSVRSLWQERVSTTEERASSTPTARAECGPRRTGAAKPPAWGSNSSICKPADAANAPSPQLGAEDGKENQPLCGIPPLWLCGETPRIQGPTMRQGPLVAPSEYSDGSDDDHASSASFTASSSEEAWTPTEIVSPHGSMIGGESGSIMDRHEGNSSAHAPPRAKLHQVTPRRARSAAESQAAQVALDQANAALARLSPPPELLVPSSASLSPEHAPAQMGKGHDVLADVAAQSKHARGDESLDESALTIANEKIRKLEHEARRADGLEVALQRLNKENARLNASLEEASVQASKLQPVTACNRELSESKGEQTRKMEARLRFLEEEVETANAELSRTKARLSSSDIELQVLRAQFEKMEHPTGVSLYVRGEPRDADSYSTSSSRACSVSDAMRRQDMEAQMDIADAERCALEKGVQSLHAHATSLREENMALHLSLQEALAKLAHLSCATRSFDCPQCGTETIPVVNPKGVCVGAHGPVHSGGQDDRDLEGVAAHPLCGLAARPNQSSSQDSHNPATVYRTDIGKHTLECVGGEGSRGDGDRLLPLVLDTSCQLL